MSDQPTLPFAPRLEGDPPYRPTNQQIELMRALRPLMRRLSQAASGLTSILLTGPEGSGKSRVIQEAEEGADVPAVISVTLREPDPMEVFAEINAAAAAREVLILEARQPPEKWFAEGVAPPDLLSRLAAVPHLTLDRPGWETLVPVLLADLAVHGHVLSEREVRDVAFALPRHLGSPRGFCRALDQVPPGKGRKATLQWALERAHVAAPGGS